MFRSTKKRLIHFIPNTTPTNLSLLLKNTTSIVTLIRALSLKGTDISHVSVWFLRSSKCAVRNCLGTIYISKRLDVKTNHSQLVHKLSRLRIPINQKFVCWVSY